MIVRGEILAGLSGGTITRIGGVLGVGGRRSKREDLDAQAALARIERAFRRLGITEAVNLWAGERSVFESFDDETRPLRDLIEDALRFREEFDDLHVTLVHEDDVLSHTLTVIYAAEHAEEDPALIVHDLAEAVETPPVDEEEYEADLEEFLFDLADELAKELGFDDEAEVYVQSALEGWQAVERA